MGVAGLGATVEDVGVVFCFCGGEDSFIGLGPRGIGLHELRGVTCFAEFRGKAGKLWQYLVDQTNFRGQLIIMDVEGKEATNVA